MINIIILVGGSSTLIAQVLKLITTFISEKTFRALAFPRPFIVIGQKNVLKNLYSQIGNNNNTYNEIVTNVTDLF